MHPFFKRSFAGNAERTSASLEQPRGRRAFYVVLAHRCAILWRDLEGRADLQRDGGGDRFRAVDKPGRDSLEYTRTP